MTLRPEATLDGAQFKVALGLVIDDADKPVGTLGAAPQLPSGLMPVPPVQESSSRARSSPTNKVKTLRQLRLLRHVVPHSTQHYDPRHCQPQNVEVEGKASGPSRGPGE